MTNPYHNVTVPQFIKDSRILSETLTFASNAHETRCNVNTDGSKMHLRKYGNPPMAYIIHPIAVCAILWDHGIDNIKMLQAALLHDTVEDTDVTIEEINAKFGKRVAAMVAGLTDVSVPGSGTREARKEEDRIHTSKQDPDTLTVKTADLIHNTTDITARDPDFAVAYTHEKALLLKAILQGGQRIKSDRSLYERAVQQLLEYHYSRAQQKFAIAWETERYLDVDKAVAEAFFIKGIQRADLRYAMVLDISRRIKESD